MLAAFSVLDMAGAKTSLIFPIYLPIFLILVLVVCIDSKLSLVNYEKTVYERSRKSEVNHFACIRSMPASLYCRVI